MSDHYRLLDLFWELAPEQQQSFIHELAKSFTAKTVWRIVTHGLREREALLFCAKLDEMVNEISLPMLAHKVIDNRHRFENLDSEQQEQLAQELVREVKLQVSRIAAVAGTKAVENYKSDVSGKGRSSPETIRKANEIIDRKERKQTNGEIARAMRVDRKWIRLVLENKADWRAKRS